MRNLRIKQKNTKHTNIHTMIKKNQEKIKDYSKHVIYISSNNVRHPVIKTFTTVHPTTLNSNSLHLWTLQFPSFKLHPITFHCPFIWLKSISISYSSISPHVTTLHLTSLRFTPFHFTALLDDFRHNSILFISPRLQLLS